MSTSVMLKLAEFAATRTEEELVRLLELLETLEESLLTESEDT